MYLTRLQPDRASKQVRADLSSAYQMHATLCRALCEPDQTPPRFLWRLEPSRSSEIPTVLIQSQSLPDWTRLERHFPGYIGAVECRKIALEHLEQEQILKFRLRSNPTVSQKPNPEAKRSKRVALTGEGEQLEWLERQGQNGGFEPLEFAVVQSEKVRLYKHTRGGAPITLMSVLYEGRLEITALAPFLNTLEGGLGHAKALGFGLLSIAAR